MSSTIPMDRSWLRPVNDAAAMTYNLEGLNVGANYDIYVVATAPAMAEWPEEADEPACDR